LQERCKDSAGTLCFAQDGGRMAKWHPERQLSAFPHPFLVLYYCSTNPFGVKFMVRLKDGQLDYSMTLSIFSEILIDIEGLRR
jgi:hypothetical protein